MIALIITNVAITLVAVAVAVVLSYRFRRYSTEAKQDLAAARRDATIDLVGLANQADYLAATTSATQPGTDALATLHPTMVARGDSSAPPRRHAAETAETADASKVSGDNDSEPGTTGT